MPVLGWARRLWSRFGGPRVESLAGPEPDRTIQITLFIPSVDRDSEPINQRLWKRAALEWLGLAFGGATAFPPGVGVWRDDGRGGRLVFDKTVVIFSYATEGALRENVANLRTFMMQMGRETRQGSVAYVLGGVFYEIPIV